MGGGLEVGVQYHVNVGAWLQQVIKQQEAIFVIKANVSIRAALGQRRWLQGVAHGV